VCVCVCVCVRVERHDAQDAVSSQSCVERKKVYVLRIVLCKRFCEAKRLETCVGKTETQRERVNVLRVAWCPKNRVMCREM
jgi:hypothetical protein